MFGSLKEDLNWRKIKLVQKTLQSKTGWYTGLSIKRYLSKKVFSLKEEGFNNQAIKMGRWKAYCHYSALVAFKNLLEKQEVVSGKKVLIHPLLPFELTDEIVKKQAEIKTLDIDKSTLMWQPGDVEKHISENPTDLVVIFAFNGIYEPVIEIAKILKNKSIPCLIFVDNPNLNYSLLDLFEEVSLGGILWDFGDSFVDDVLNEVMTEPLQTKRWFASWNIETRTRSLLEYHLSESQKNYKIILEAYHSLLLGDGKNVKSAFNWGLKKTLQKERKYNDREAAENAIKENYLKALNSAVPDIFFDLHGDEEQTTEESQREDILYKSSLFQAKAKEFYDYFVYQVQARPEGTLEIPNFQLKKTYLEYFFYTTERSFWQQNLHEKNLKFRNQLRVHPLVAENPNLSEAQFAAEYLFSVKLSNAVMDGAYLGYTE